MTQELERREFIRGGVLVAGAAATALATQEGSLTASRSTKQTRSN